MTSYRRVLLTALLLIGGRDSFAQDSVLVRQSNGPTPAVDDTAVVRQRRVDVGALDVLTDTSRAATLRLDLFPDVSLVAVRERTEPTANGMTWSGTLDGFPQSSVVFVQVGDELVGSIYAPFGFFRIRRAADGGYLAQQVDHRDDAGDDSVPAGGPEAEDTPAGSRPAARSSWRTLADSGDVIDVMVAFTGDALAGMGGETRALATTDLAVAETNQAFRNSGVNTRLRLVHTATIDYAETGDGSIDLQRLRLPTDGFLDGVHAARDAAGADLVVLVVEEMDGFCGIGYVNGMLNTGGFGFSVVARTCASNGRTFAHEVGHNMGAAHDWYVDASGGAFPASKGYTGLTGRFRDLMAYSNLCVDTRTSCSQLLQYSNPQLLHNGQRTGVAAGTSLTCEVGNRENVECDADVATAFASMARVVARFRESRTSVTGPLVPTLRPGGEIYSDSGRYRLTYQTNGNLVLYDTRPASVLWDTKTTGQTAGQAVLQGDGNFVIYNGSGTPVWSSGTINNPGARLYVQDDGNLVIYATDGRPIWDRNR
jgi:hypothetical protein